MQKKTLKSKVIDYVEEQGSCRWKEIHEFMTNEYAKQNGNIDKKVKRGYFSSYFSKIIPPYHMYKGKMTAKWYIPDEIVKDLSKGILLIPSTNEPRYLIKKDKRYYVNK